MNFKKESGITIIALIITIILMLILVGISIKFGAEAIDKAKLEDIKTDMISIKSKAKIIAEQYNFKDIENLVGTALDTDTNQAGIQTGTYTIPEQLKAKLEATDSEQNPIIDISKLYVLTNEDFTALGIKTQEVDVNRFYIVYYNLIDTNACEIYYSQGLEGIYSLGELQDL